MKARFTKGFALVVLLCALLGMGIAAIAFAQAETPLDKKYDVAIVPKAEVDPKVEADYPTAGEEYRSSLVQELRDKKRFKEVIVGDGDSGQGGLVLKSRVKSMRIVSSAARFWGGAFAGSSEITVEVKLVDSKTGNVLREKTLSSANNPFGAIYSSSDKSLPGDMGKIVSAYVMTVVPQ